MIISIIGSGGKTTRMKELLHQYKEEGKTVYDDFYTYAYRRRYFS